MAQPFSGNDMISQALGACVEVAPGSNAPGRRNFRLQLRNASPLQWLSFFILAAVPLLTLSGCGGGLVLNPSSSTSSAGLVASPSSLSYGTLTVGQSASQSASVINSTQQPVVISSINVSDSSFKITDHLTLPLTLAAGQSQSLHIVFQPANAGDVNAQVLISSGSSTQASAQVQSASGSSTQGSTTISLKGSGKAAAAAALAVSSLSCTTASFTTSGTDTCTVTLNAPAPSGGVSVGLASDNSSVTVPGSVKVTTNTTSITFTATVAAVTSAQTATLQASINSTSASFAIQLGPPAASTLTSTLGVSPTSLSFGNVTINTALSQSVTLSSTGSQAVTISGITVSGAGFSSTGTTLPLTLNPGQTATLNIQFDPTVAGSVTGQVAIASNSSTGATTLIALSGAGVSPTVTAALSSFACASTSLTGTTSDICTVGLNGPAPSTGFAVSLASSSASVSVPASLVVPANATSASFTASATSVTTTQTVTLQASAGGVTQSVALQLNAAAPVLTVNATSISFGSVNLNTPSTQSVTLSSTGSQAVTVSGASVSGTGFSLTGGTFPITLNPGQSATLSVQFDPTTAGAATGQLTITSNSSTASTALVTLSGTGQSVSHSVTLTWNAPSSSPVPVVGYKVYRALGGSTSYQQLNASAITQTTYMDSTVQSGQTYDYYVESVDSSGVQSSPSNITVATIP